MYIDPNETLMVLYDGAFRLAIRDFLFTLSAQYELISDPPVIADIGIFKLSLDNTTFAVNASTDFDHDGGFFVVTLHELLWEMDPFAIVFGGVSDIMDVLGRFISYVGNVIGRRLQSILVYKGPEKVGKLLNKLIEAIPDEIDIPGTDLYLEGGLTDKCAIVAGEYMSLPMDISL